MVQVKKKQYQIKIILYLEIKGKVIKDVIFMIICQIYSSSCFRQCIQSQFQSNFHTDLHILMFNLGDVDHGCLRKEQWKLLCFPITCLLNTYLKARGYPFLHLFAAIHKILRGGSHRFQSNQPKRGHILNILALAGV